MHLYPDDKIRIEGYEKMEGQYSQHFDLIASNIPFGDTAVFDPLVSNHSIPAIKQSTQAIHNYFFVKSLQAACEGGAEGIGNDLRNMLKEDFPQL